VDELGNLVGGLRVRIESKATGAPWDATCFARNGRVRFTVDPNCRYTLTLPDVTPEPIEVFTWRTPQVTKAIKSASAGLATGLKLKDSK
jgi:hypothetical protein